MQIFTVDSFTDQPFRGNPAGVCLLDAPASAEWMQAVAAELRHAETAFVVPDDGGGHQLRWFTPTVEVDLCGHATLATAHVLYERGARGRLVFATRSGTLTTEQTGNDLITMDFPATPAEPVDPPVGLADALGEPFAGVWRSPFDLLVELASAQAVRDLAPDLHLLGSYDVRGVIVTAVGDEPGVDFVSRFFAPASGVDEDPVTGSAHCTLSPFWSDRLGRTELLGAQLSARYGRVHTVLAGDRVRLSGRAVTVWSGELHVKPY